MSRVDHIVSRRREDARPVRKSQAPRPYYDANTKKVEWVRVPRHRQGGQWWRSRFAELVERRLPDGGYQPRPAMPKITLPERPRPVLGPRPDGVTRQVHRANYRRACKARGVDWRTP